MTISSDDGIQSTVWASTATSKSDLKAWIEKCRDAPVELCGATKPHIVHPKALGDDMAICANCFQQIEGSQ